MSELIKPHYPGPKQTVFETAWLQEANDLSLFRSDEYNVIALADPYPKLPLQMVIAPSEGSAGMNVHFAELPRSMKRRLHEVSDAFGEKMLTVLSQDQRAIVDEVSGQEPHVHIEGFGIRDHAHIVMFGAERRQGERLYNGTSLGEDTVRRTVELMKFTAEETARLNQRLAHLPVW